MRRLVLIAVLSAAVMLQPGWAAEKARAPKVECYTQSAIEAEQAIRFLTDVMVISSTCQDGKLKVHVEGKFEDGTKAQTEIIRACTPKG